MKMKTLLGLVAALMISSACFADDGQNLVIQNVILEPGDVISFLGGGGSAVIPGDTYGHTGMYLGVDPVTNEKVFLDFTTDKEGPYRGRISGAKKFLSENSSHIEFDVHRLNDNSMVDQEKLIAQAKDIAENKEFGALIDCANASSRTLSAATGLDIIAIRPDMYTENSQFRQASPVRINIEKALGELGGAPDDGVVNGTWAGSATSVTENTERVDFTVTLHIQNVTSGTSRVDWNGGYCAGVLSGGYEGNQTYSYQVHYTEGNLRTSMQEQGCLDGSVRLVLGSDGIAHYTWNGTDLDGTAASVGTVLEKK